MDFINSIAKTSIVNGLKDVNSNVRLEAIHSILHLKLHKEPDIQSRLHELVEDPVEYVAGLAAAVLLEQSVDKQELLGKTLLEYYQKFPYTTTVCYVGFLSWMAASGLLPISFKLEEFDSVKLDNSEKKIGTQQFERIIYDVVCYYLMPYWIAFLEEIKDERKFAKMSKQHNRFVELIVTKDYQSHLFETHKFCLAWILIFLSLLSRQNISTSLGQQVLSEAQKLGDVIKIQTWLTSLQGHGANVIDTLYHLPKGYKELRNSLIKLMENGPENGEMSMYWWTVSSAIDKLGDSKYCGDKVVCEALLAKLKAFIPAELAYESRKVGMFQVMYVPVWPHGEKGIYIKLANALAEVGDKTIKNKLTPLLKTSPYPEVIAKALQRMEERLNVFANSDSTLKNRVEDRREEKLSGENEFLEGIKYKEKGNIDQAIHWLQTSLDINPESCNAWYNLAFCWVDRKEYATALKCFEKALELEPNAIDIITNIVSLKLMFNEPQRALELSERALRIDPNNQYGWLAKAQTLRYMGDKKKAFKSIKEGLLKCPLGFNLLEHFREFNSAT